jgi:hypothetical protein
MYRIGITQSARLMIESLNVDLGIFKAPVFNWDMSDSSFATRSSSIIFSSRSNSNRPVEATQIFPSMCKTLAKTVTKATTVPPMVLTNQSLTDPLPFSIFVLNDPNSFCVSAL